MVYSLSADVELFQDIYPTLELGYQRVGINRDTYRYSSSGLFSRVGVDVNFLKYERTDVYEMLFAGMRYGFSRFSHQAKDIQVPDDYFEGSRDGTMDRKQLSAHWISIVGGARIQLFENLFLGWSVQGNIKLAQTDDNGMVPNHVPGFGKGEKRAGVVIQYTLSYRIPLHTYKPRKIIQLSTPEGEPGDPGVNLETEEEEEIF
jgi:hypothetical protein